MGSQFNGDVRIVGEQFRQTLQSRSRLWGDLSLVKRIKHIAHQHWNIHRRKRELQDILMLLVENRIYLKLIGEIEITIARCQEDIPHPRLYLLFKRTIGLHGKFEVGAITSHHLHLCRWKFISILFVHPTFHSEQAFRIGELKYFVPSSTSGRAWWWEITTIVESIKGDAKIIACWIHGCRQMLHLPLMEQSVFLSKE